MGINAYSIYGGGLLSSVMPPEEEQAASPQVVRDVPEGAVSISWLGLVIALIVLRVLYEMAE